MTFFSSLASSLLPTVLALEEEQIAAPEEKAAPAAVEEEEEEEEEEPEDLAPGIREACGNQKPCSTFKHHFEECTERIMGGNAVFKGEDCVEELFHFMHCVDDCSAGKVFASLK